MDVRASLVRRVAAAAVLLSVLPLAACTPAGTSGPSPRVPDAAASASPSADPATGVLAGTKPVAKQTLPTGVEEWRIARRTASGNGSTAYVYGRASDAQARLVATLTSVPLTSEALAVALPERHALGPATCGVLAGGTASACYVPLDGGSLMVTGTPDEQTLAALAARLYEGLA